MRAVQPATTAYPCRFLSLGSWSLEVYNPWPGVMPDKPASNDYKPGFMVDLMLKDLGLAMDAASSAEVRRDCAPLCTADCVQ